MSDQRRNALKTILQLACQLLWVTGLVVGLSGVYLLMKYKQSSLFFSDSYITMPAILTFASAAFLLASGFLGSWLSLRDSTFLQGLFVYLLVVVFCLESSASALAYFHSIKLDSEITSLSGVFQNYTGSSQDPNSRAVDATQEEVCAQPSLMWSELQSCSVVGSMTTGIGYKPPGLTVLENVLFLTAAATLLSPPAMALWTSHGSFTHSLLCL